MESVHRNLQHSDHTTFALAPHAIMGVSADREIADSQADEEEVLGDHYLDPAESFRTETTVLLSSGTQLAARTSEINVSTLDLLFSPSTNSLWWLLL